MIPEKGTAFRKVKVAATANYIFHLQSATWEAAPQAIQVADRFHVCKNLTEATQLLLARCQAEIAAASKIEEPVQDESCKPVISIEEWRPKEPAHVGKMRLARRAGRKTRYEQVVERREQGLTTKEIACQLDLSERTVHMRHLSGSLSTNRKHCRRRRVSNTVSSIHRRLLKVGLKCFL